MDNKIVVLTIGTEITEGLSRDTNSFDISRMLFERGFIVNKHVSISDSLEGIVKEVVELKKEFKIIIVTGGLGPTADDVTKEALAQVFKRELVVNNSLYDKAVLTHKKEEARKLSSIPKGSTILKPPKGMAASFIIKHEKGVLISLPGVPSELNKILFDEVLPFLENNFLPKIKKRRELFIIYNFNEVEIEEKLKSIKLDFNYGLLPKEEEVHLYITTKDQSIKNAEEKLKAIEEKLKKIFYRNIHTFNERSLEEIVVNKLIKKKITVAVAESSTAGLLGYKLASIPNASKIFLGGLITYAYSVKEKLGVPRSILLEHGAVSKTVATLMALRVKDKIGSDIAVSITGIAGPAGATKKKPLGLHYIGVVCKDNKPMVKKFIFKGNRKKIQQQASRQALLLIIELIGNLNCKLIENKSI